MDREEEFTNELRLVLLPIYAMVILVAVAFAIAGLLILSKPINAQESILYKRERLSSFNQRWFDITGQILNDTPRKVITITHKEPAAKKEEQAKPKAKSRRELRRERRAARREARAARREARRRKRR